jgi:D-tyrosyl-tRNA(Tyr) deacylase
MRALIQRVIRAAVRVEDMTKGSIGPGMLVLLGVSATDTHKDADYLADKLLHLRIFSDDAGKMNRSALDAKAAFLVVSQFTLYGDCRKGRRPGFDAAAPPERARDLYDWFTRRIRESGLETQTGVFQAHMQVELVNDGPVTFLVESPSS